jgi:hypothetical protein
MLTEVTPIDLKPCCHCGRQIERRRYPCGSWEGPRAYARRIYCSAQCAQRGSRMEPRTHKPKRKRIPADLDGQGGSYIPKPTRVALQFMERDVPITEWETSRWKR